MLTTSNVVNINRGSERPHGRNGVMARFSIAIALFSMFSLGAVAQQKTAPAAPKAAPKTAATATTATPTLQLGPADTPAMIADVDDSVDLASRRLRSSLASIPKKYISARRNGIDGKANYFSRFFAFLPIDEQVGAARNAVVKARNPWYAEELESVLLHVEELRGKQIEAAILAAIKEASTATTTAISTALERTVDRATFDALAKVVGTSAVVAQPAADGQPKVEAKASTGLIASVDTLKTRVDNIDANIVLINTALKDKVSAEALKAVTDTLAALKGLVNTKLNEEGVKILIASMVNTLRVELGAEFVEFASVLTEVAHAQRIGGEVKRRPLVSLLTDSLGRNARVTPSDEAGTAFKSAADLQVRIRAMFPQPKEVKPAGE